MVLFSLRSYTIAEWEYPRQREVERVELAILRRLAVGPARVTDLVQAVGLAQSTLSKHLACLRDCDLVASDPVGRASLFRLTQPSLTELLGCAETVLAATGNAVALCPNYGVGSCAAAETS